LRCSVVGQLKGGLVPRHCRVYGMHLLMRFPSLNRRALRSLIGSGLPPGDDHP
jgi:hypothetical protein